MMTRSDLLYYARVLLLAALLLALLVGGTSAQASVIPAIRTAEQAKPHAPVDVEIPGQTAPSLF